MNSNSGNGYLWNVLHRGATRLDKSRQLAPTATRSEAPDTAAAELLETHSEAVVAAASNVSQADTQPANPLPESQRMDRAIATTPTTTPPARLQVDPPHAEDLSTTTPSRTTTSHGLALLTPSPAKESEPALAPLADTAAIDQPQTLHQSPAARDSYVTRISSPVQSMSEVFELKLPDNFFNPHINARNPLQLATNPDQDKLDHVSALTSANQGHDQPASSFVQGEPPHGFQNVQLNEQLNGHLKELVVSASPEPRESARSNVESRLPIESLAPSRLGPPKQDDATTQLAVISKAPEQRERPRESSPPVPSPAFEPATAAPKRELAAEYFMPRVPPVAQVATSPPIRLRINRMDINIINTLPTAPPARERVPDVSQILDRVHLNRLELLL